MTDKKEKKFTENGLKKSVLRKMIREEIFSLKEQKMKESLNISFVSDWKNIKGTFTNVIKGHPAKLDVENVVKKALKLIGLGSQVFNSIQPHRATRGFEVSLSYQYAFLSPVEKKRFDSIIKKELERKRF